MPVEMIIRPVVQRLSKALFVLMLLIGLAPDQLRAQDPQFSQFYAAPLYLNPAFAGATDRGRVGVNYRNQWPSLQHSFVTKSAYLDYFAKSIESGFGVLINQRQESFLKYRSSEVAGMYSYKLRVAEKVMLRMGIQLSYFQKDIHFEDLIFSDQIDIDNGLITGPSGQVFDQGLKVDYLSVSSGGLLYTDTFWLGTAVHHMNEPNESFLGGESRVSSKFSVHAGYKLKLGDGYRLRTVNYQFQQRSVTFAVNYKRQGGFNQLDAGVQLYFQPLVIGGWYRGIPVQSVNKVIKNESVIALVGLELNQDLSFGYSYDFTVSQLAGSTGGAHEFSLTLSFGKIVKRTRRDTILPCFKY